MPHVLEKHAAGLLCMFELKQCALVCYRYSQLVLAIAMGLTIADTTQLVCL